MIEWTEQAARQLEQAHNYISLTNSEEVAADVALRILASIEQLSAFPMAGRPGRVPGKRELVIANTPFIAAYKADPKGIVVLAVYHGARKWPDEF